MRTVASLILISLLTFGCVSTESKAIYERDVIDGAKVVALSGPRHPWTIEIEKRLRAQGYEVKRFASTTRTTELTSPNRIESYDEATTRVVLHVDGYAPNTVMTRCFAGGFRFEYITAELIDTARNETLASYSNSGFSENCPPLSGTIFQDIVNMVDAVFA